MIFWIAAALLASGLAALMMWRAARAAADARWAQALREDGIDAFVAAWETQPVFSSRAALSAAATARLRQEQGDNDAEGLARSLEGAGQGAMEPLRDLLEAIRVPTLIVSGDLDPVGTDRAIEVAAAIPGAQHIRLPHVGHTPHVEHLAALTRAIGPALRAASIPIATRTP